MEFKADAAIDHVSQGSTYVHAHLIVVSKAVELWAI